MNDVALATLRIRITGVFPAQIRAAMTSLTDDQLWWRPNESSNSIGNLILHLTGSLNYFLNRNLGGIAFDRDREKEFSERTPRSKAELMAAFDAMAANAERTFDGLTPESLLAPSPEPAMSKIVFEDLMNIVTHIASHAGQIVWIAKMFESGSLDEVWMRTHREHGAWKKRGDRA